LKCFRDFFFLIFSNLVLAEFNVPFERIHDIQKQINQLNTDLKRCMDDCKEIYTKHVERLQRERDTALLAASQMEDPNNISAQLPPGVEISNKKVSGSLHFSWKLLKLFLDFSVQIATATRWQSARCVEERPTVPPSVSAKTG
jgi:hypothetical protein